MGSLGLHADPDGWLNAGYSIRTLMDSLDSELYDADRIGGASLSAHWAGPVAEAFNGNWSGLRSRAEDLIAQGRRAAAAITDFGGKLEDFVKRAADLESYWLSFGLQIGLDGMHFALPWGFEQLSPVHQASFHQWLTESERDVTAMWSDVRAAVDDVVTALESLIAAFEDYVVLDLGATAGIIGGVLNGYIADPPAILRDPEGLLQPRFDRTAIDALDDAFDKVVVLGDDASSDMWAAAEASTRNAVRDATFARYAKLGGKLTYVASAAYLLWEIKRSAKKDGVLGGIEDHTGDATALALTPLETAVGVAVATAVLPEAAVGVGAIVLTGVVALGVSSSVQWVVDHNKTTINHAIKDVGHGVEDAAGWEAKHVEGLVKFA
jgi:hypothetical protein